MMTQEPTQSRDHQHRDHQSLKIETPEGVALCFQIPDLSLRFGALLIDLFFITLITLACGLMCGALCKLTSVQGVQRGFIYTLLILSFPTRVSYFTLFELRGLGVTPGKRRSQLRVMDRSGQPLTARAIVWRNLFRELDLFMLISLWVIEYDQWALDDVALKVASLIIFTLPLFNRYQMRLGDLIANTVVVALPTYQLSPDLSDSHRDTRDLEARDLEARDLEARDLEVLRFTFTQAQLDVYGIYELQRLEGILRDIQNRSVGYLDHLYKVIAHKIGWPRDELIEAPERQLDFLRAFYAAQREQLERRMMLGDRRESKHDRP